MTAARASKPPPALPVLENHVVRYTVPNLGPETSKGEQEKLMSALKTVPGIKDIALTLKAHEITFGINGPEPKVKLLKEACDKAGFTLGARV